MAPFFICKELFGMNSAIENKPRVVIIGGGFGGLYAAQKLKNAPVQVTLIDRKNYHLFQPLLYQVATGSLSPGDIASPLRGILENQKNANVILAEISGFDIPGKKVLLADGSHMPYDNLIVAGGSVNHYFGHEDWTRVARGLKTVEDAADIRAKIFMAFEMAERESDHDKIKALLTFAVIGGGPTGVEMAGAMAEIARETLTREFRNIDPAQARIILIEGFERILRTFPDGLSRKAEKSLRKLRVEVMTGAIVTDIAPGRVNVTKDGLDYTILTETVFWAAGVRANSLGEILAQNTGAKLNRTGQIMVNEFLQISGYPDIFVIGDMACAQSQQGKPYPGIAPVARQQGRYVARMINRKLQGKTIKPFSFINLGTMATIGRSSAVADLHWLKLSGFLGWLTWLFVHLMYIVEFENRLLVFIQWAWNYFTRERSNRLILGNDTTPVAKLPARRSELPAPFDIHKQ